MSRDPYRDMRRHVAAEAYHWQEPDVNRSEDGTQVDALPAKAIVVGYDGTAGALPALRWALAEARGRQVPLTIVRAWQWDEELAEPGLLVASDELEALAHTTLPDWVRDAEGVSVVLAPRAAGPAVVKESKDAALIVVGRRRLGALQRAWLGSTSAYVVQHAPCAVVVVPEVAPLDVPVVAQGGAEHDQSAGSDTRSAPVTSGGGSPA